jgi:hypothetical protein
VALSQPSAKAFPGVGVSAAEAEERAAAVIKFVKHTAALVQARVTRARASWLCAVRCAALWCVLCMCNAR